MSERIRWRPKRRVVASKPKPSNPVDASKRDSARQIADTADRFMAWFPPSHRGERSGWRDE
jgi:hypothetical protein